MSDFEPSVAALRLALAVAQTGKLTAAAEKLGISQSGASHALRGLEGQVGTALFVRQAEGLRPSEAGQALLPRFERVLAELDAIGAATGGLAQLKAGSLRIASVPSLLASILPTVLREFGQRYPGIEMSIFEGTDDEVRDWARSGMAHVGFAALPVDGVAAKEIARDEWLALVPAGLFAGREAIGLAELARHRFLMSGGGCEAHIQRIFAAAGQTIADAQMVKQMPTIQAMVGEELGVSLVPSLAVGKAYAGTRALRLRPRLFRRIGMLRAHGAVSTPAVEAWMELVRARLIERPRAAAPKRGAGARFRSRIR